MTIKIADLDRVMDNIRVKAPSVLDGVIHMEMFNTFNEFFQISKIWQEVIPTNVDNTYVRGSTVDIIPSEGSVVTLMWVNNGDSIPRRAAMFVPGVMTFVDVTDTAAVWEVCVALTCSDPIPKSGTLEGVPRVPDWVVTKYFDGIIAGVLYRLMMQPAKPYSNPKMAVYYQRVYKNAVSQATTDALHQNLYGGQTWSFPQAFATRRQNKGW